MMEGPPHGFTPDQSHPGFMDQNMGMHGFPGPFPHSPMHPQEHQSPNFMDQNMNHGFQGMDQGRTWRFF